MIDPWEAHPPIRSRSPEPTGDLGVARFELVLGTGVSGRREVAPGGRRSPTPSWIPPL